MSSGETDEWDDVGGARIDWPAGALIILSTDGDPLTDEGAIVACIYAPGMWMKIEYETDG